jgi:hypothetical protein
MTVFARFSSLPRAGLMSLAMACGGLASSQEAGTELDRAGLNGSAVPDGTTAEAAPAQSFSHVTVHDAAGHPVELRLSDGTRSEDGITTHLRVGVWERLLDLTRRHEGSFDAVTVAENGEPLASATFGAAQDGSSPALHVFDRENAEVAPSVLMGADPVAAALLTPAAWQSIDARFSALSDYSLELAGASAGQPSAGGSDLERDESGGVSLSSDAAGGESAPLLGTATQALSIGTGALGTGGLNAWGCWSSCCESTCTAGHYEPDCCGRWIWVCDARSCTDPCERCIWPY